MIQLLIPLGGNTPTSMLPERVTVFIKGNVTLSQTEV